ncbi:hypothetical protein JCM14036_06990 [Desulfotomaculum defluvii]
MKHVQRAMCLIALVAMLLQCGVPALAAGSPPPLPATYWGSVKTSGGSAVQSGTVEAYVDGVFCSSIEIMNGMYGSDSGIKLDAPGTTSSKVVSFKVNGKFADQTTTWKSGEDKRVDLTVDLPDEKPPASGGGEGGGGPAAQTKNQPSATISDKAVKEAINRAIQTGKVTVQAPAGEGRLTLSLDQFKDIQSVGKPLETKVNNITMIIASNALKVPELRLEELNQVQFAAAPVDKDDVKEIIAQANRGGIFSIAGEVFELSASAILEDGKQKSIKQFNGKIQVTLPVPQSVRDLAAEGQITVGYYNEQTKSWQDVGGKYDPVSGTITFETDHFSKYAVMEVKTKTIAKTSAFNDIANHWANENITFMAEKGFAGGVGDGRFAPEANITRAQFAAFLVRILAVPESSAALNFTDVKAGDWYYASLATAYQAGLIKGVTTDKIAPNENITREQMAVMLVRAMEYKGKIAPAAKDLTFTDKSKVSPWAVSGISQSAQLNFIGGFPNGTFMPQANATRAQAIVMLHRLYNQVQ